VFHNDWRRHFYLFTLTANGFLPSGSGTTIRQHTTLKQNTSHKTTQMDTLHTMNTMEIQLQLQLIKK
jgi:hypothetical protein